ncbi:hypothetical protein VNO77_16148 [Canavalia gladiata]|uniref:Uncharacterized protein n=1 Tax=Canavalia gladiata TaxID=3824 RepID=A0AAN9QWC2_CANGL
MSLSRVGFGTILLQSKGHKNAAHCFKIQNNEAAAEDEEGVRLLTAWRGKLYINAPSWNLSFWSIFASVLDCKSRKTIEWEMAWLLSLFVETLESKKSSGVFLLE